MKGLRGELCPTAKLSSADVDRIREAILFGATPTQLTTVYPVARTSISSIAHGKTWTDSCPVPMRGYVREENWYGVPRLCTGSAGSGEHFGKKRAPAMQTSVMVLDTYFGPIRVGGRTLTKHAA